MSDDLVWPDPVPCRSENPVQGIRRCEARRTSTRCRWLKVQYCGIHADEMLDAMELLRLNDFTWFLEDDAEADDVADAMENLTSAVNSVVATTQREENALALVRWLLGLLKQATRYGCGLSGRFGERIDTKDRY